MATSKMGSAAASCPIWLSDQAECRERRGNNAGAGNVEPPWARSSAPADTQSKATTATAIGGLIQNTACQPKVSVSQPPSTGPAAVVSAEAAAHTPTARLRSAFG